MKLLDALPRGGKMAIAISMILGGGLMLMAVVLHTLIVWVWSTWLPISSSFTGMGTSMIGLRAGTALVIVLVQLVSLVAGLSRASDEKRKPLRLLRGYSVLVVLSGSAVAFAPLSWGYPWLLWAAIVVFTTFARAFRTVSMTTGYYKPSENGNRRLNAHDDGAIRGDLQSLGWGLMMALILATAWSVHNLANLF